MTLKTQLALMTTEGVDTWDLNVDTDKGAVTLHGKVATEEAKKKAETVAAGIEGAKSVKNLLQVVPKPNREAVEDADDVVKSNVEKALEADAALKRRRRRLGQQGRRAAGRHGRHAGSACDGGRHRQPGARRAARLDQRQDEGRHRVDCLDHDGQGFSAHVQRRR